MQNLTVTSCFLPRP